MKNDFFTSCEQKFGDSVAINELKKYKQWVVWRKQEKGNSSTKIPFNPNYNCPASVTDRSTWGSYDDAMRAYNEMHYSGIGFVFTEDDPICGIDLDHCRDLNTGNVTPWAQDAIDMLNSYTEISPSGDGFHILVKSDLPVKGSNKKGLDGSEGSNGVFEAYKSARYFTITMNVVEEKPVEIRDGQKAVTALFEKYLAKVNTLPNQIQVTTTPESAWDGKVESLPIKDEARQLILNGAKKGYRSEAMMTTINHLIYANLTDAEIAQVFEQYPIGEKYLDKNNREDWLKKQICKGRAAVTKRASIMPLQWEDPVPLSNPDEDPRDYPIDALPPILKDAVTSYQADGQQPVGLIASSALATASLACQGLVNVARNTNLVGPISLYIMTIAESGERKTGSDKVFTAAIREWQKEKRKELQPQLKKNERDKELWEAKHKNLINHMKKLQMGGKPKKEELDMDATELELSKHEQNPVQNINAPSFFYEDITPAKLATVIAEGYPSASIWSDEAGLVVGSYGMKNEMVMSYFAMLNRLWDGGELNVDRKSADSAHISGKRLTCNLMLQRAILNSLIQDNDGLSRGIGLLARFLISQPPSTIGKRMYRESGTNYGPLNKLHRHITDLLKRGLDIDEDGALELQTIHFSPEAKKTWIEFFNHTEVGMQYMGKYSELKDTTSKIAENAARIAGCFHVIENGPSGLISATTMEQAVQVAQWYLDEAKRILASASQPKELVEAEMLWKWVVKEGQTSVKTSDISQKGPNSLRGKKKRDETIETLISTGHLKWMQEGKNKCLKVNPLAI